MRVLYQFGIEVVDGRNRELEHDLYAGIKAIEPLNQFCAKERFRGGFVRNRNVNFRFDDRNKSRPEDGVRIGELLFDNFADPFGVRFQDDRAHLRPENAVAHRAIQKFRKPVDRLHETHAARKGRKSLIHFENGNDALLLPEIFGGWKSVDRAVHRLFKENCRKNAIRGEGRTLDDPRPHPMDEIEHLLLSRIGVFRDSVKRESLGRTAAALVESRDKTFSAAHSFCLLFIHRIASFLLYAAEFSVYERAARFESITNSVYHRPILKWYNNRGLRKMCAATLRPNTFLKEPEGGCVLKSKGVTGHLLAIVTIFIWGTTFVASKLLLQDFTPIEVLFLRFALGYAALCLASLPGLFSGHTSPRRTIRQELIFAAAGFMGVTVYFLMENTALTFSTASNVAILVAVSPLFSAILSFLFLKDEKLNKRFFIGFAVAMAGIILVSLNGKFALRLNPAGDLMAVAAAFAWAVYSILQKRIQTFGYSVIALTRKCFFYGILFMIPFMIGMRFHPSPEALMNPSNLLPLLYLGLGASAVCYATWNFALHILGPVQVSVYIYLVPFVGVVFAAIVLHEKITAGAVAGVALILLGLYLSENSFARMRKRKTDSLPGKPTLQASQAGEDEPQAPDESPEET